MTRAETQAAARWGKRDDTIVHESEPFNVEPDPAVLAGSALTPVEAFYSRNHGPVPDIDPAAWRLRVDGLVRRSLELSLEELRGFDHHCVTATLQCAGNRRAGLIEVAEIAGEDPWRGGAIGTATWSGARLADVLAVAGAAAEASDVAFSAPDLTDLATPTQAYGSSIPIGKARQPEVLLAWTMNDAPLSRVHGAPVRVVVPCYIGARSVKWVERICIQDQPSDNYFQATAYRIPPRGLDRQEAAPEKGTSLGPWTLNSEVLQPANGSAVRAGEHRAIGYAVAAERRRVARVEVSADGGETWADAVLEDDQGPWAWRRWHLDVELAEGRRTLLSRAWDDSGEQQPSDPAAVWNPKGYVNTSYGRTDVDVR